MQQVHSYHKASSEEAYKHSWLSNVLWSKFKADFEAAEDKDFYVELCTFSYSAVALKAGGFQPSSVEYNAVDEGFTGMQRLQAFCSEKLALHRLFMGGITYDGWGVEIEVNYYPYRGNHGQFGLHKDDYVREGSVGSDEAGVMFVGLIYLVDYPVLGPEVMLDAGSRYDFAELTRPQIASLPPSFARRVIQSKEALLDNTDVRKRVYCPIIEPWSEIMFCDTIAIHQTPAFLENTPHELFYETNRSGPNATGGDAATFPLNTRNAQQVPQDLQRDLVAHYVRAQTNPNVAAVFENTRDKKRSFMRLTFRAKRP